MLRLYNTLTRKVEEFKPINPPYVGFYSCGPTVYDYAHIGHARTFVFADILQRVLEFNGYKVKRVMNITDVGHLTSDADTGEDKMEKGAKKEKKSVWEIADFYTQDFFELLKKLNIKKPEIITKATDYIPEMIKLIEKLEEKGFTYKLPDGIYFDTFKLADYGKLTGQTLEQLQKTLKAGIRVETVEGKKNVTDFALWKFTPAGVKRQMEWQSPWGRGFPGWHIECSAMSMEKLGETFDIHTGGVDHIPIHHSNEIAQSEIATSKNFVNFWVHGEHLLVDGQKMSKSSGNFYRVSDIEEKGFDPLSLRYLFLSISYRTQMNFTWKALEAAQNAYEGIAYQVLSINPPAGEQKKAKRTMLSEEKLVKINQLREKFTEAINDDLNMPVALSIVWEVLKSGITSEDKYDLLVLFDEVLGLGIRDIKAEDVVIPEEIKKLADERERLRMEKKFKEADEVRKELEKRGFLVEDTQEGLLLKRSST